ncbi:MAG: hypothetical protein WCT05_01100 [Lentisphaeria bacterium]
MKSWILTLICTGVFLPLLSLASEVPDPEIQKVELDTKVVFPGEILKIKVCYEQPDGSILWGYAFSGLLSQLPQGADKVFQVIKYKDSRWDNAKLAKWKYFSVAERTGIKMRNEAAIPCEIGTDWPVGDYSVKVILQFRHPEYQKTKEQTEEKIRYIKKSFRFTVVRNTTGHSEE